MKWQAPMCECGRAPKEFCRTAEEGQRELYGCRYCNDLDGKTAAERDTINALRGVNYASIDTVATERGLSERSTYRTLRRMVQRGMLVTFFDVEDPKAPDPLQYRIAPIHNRGKR